MRPCIFRSFNAYRTLVRTKIRLQNESIKRDMAYQTQLQTPQKSKHDSPSDRLSMVLEALREEWRDGLQGRRIGQATGLLRQVQNQVQDPQSQLSLARVEVRLDAYHSLSTSRRQAELRSIAADLKRLQSVIGTRPQKSEKSPEVSTPPTAPVTHSVFSGHSAPPLAPSAPVRSLPRVGNAVEKRLAKLGISVVEDVLTFLPRRHIDYSKTMSIRDAVGFGAKGEVTVRATVSDISSYDGPPARVTVRLSDPTGVLRVTWFNPYIARQLRVGDEIAISGVLEHGYGNPSATSPEWELIGGPGLSTGRLTPVYNLTQGVSQKQVRSLTRAALDATHSTLTDFLPEGIRRRHTLPSLISALENAHYPSDQTALKRAHARLSFDELFLLQLGLVKMKRRRQSGISPSFAVDSPGLAEFLAGLPFQLTSAQRHALGEVLADLGQSVPMARLLQGDVGSGKTIVAAAASLVAAGNENQTAIMAPTEVLAEQHFHNFTSLFSHIADGRRPRVGLLTGSTPKKEREHLLQLSQAGELEILVGTHALIEDTVKFSSLGLIVIDEQHRFGVKQRGILATRTGDRQPHVLSMTATPIPRTLNLVLNGDLDVSIIDEQPPGRIPIETKRYVANDRQQAWELVRREVSYGRQAFVICPLVEESETLDAKAAVTEAEHLQKEVFPELQVQVLHGRMPGKKKDQIMEEFRQGKANILVSTSVIEVGIDIPNATVMLIEGAERFGLAQLHQFRGRVGRGPHQSYCLLLADEASEEAEQRLDMMVSSNDGFALAELDLQLRGPGDFLGTRQSGLPELATTSQWFDTRTLAAARKEAEIILSSDPMLRKPDHRLLRERAVVFWQDTAPDLALA
jgi:ATP-dependent DNA helicase RecG